MQAALEALSTIGAGNVTVTGSLTALDVTFGGLPGSPVIGLDAAAITADLTGLTGGTPVFANTETRKGGPGAAMAVCAWSLGDNVENVDDTTDPADDRGVRPSRADYPDERRDVRARRGRRNADDPAE